jgi:hypothetical protein
MFGDSRVVTTAFLRKLNNTAQCDDLQVGSLAASRLREDGLHVVVPIGHVHGLTEKVVCQAQLTMEQGRPLMKEVLVSPELLDTLPTAFTVLTMSSDLVPMTVDKLDEELEAFLTAEAVAGDGPLEARLEDAGEDG